MNSLLPHLRFRLKIARRHLRPGEEVEVVTVVAARLVLEVPAAGEELRKLCQEQPLALVGQCQGGLLEVEVVQENLLSM